MGEPQEEEQTSPGQAQPQVEQASWTASGSSNPVRRHMMHTPEFQATATKHSATVPLLLLPCSRRWHSVAALLADSSEKQHDKILCSATGDTTGMLVRYK